MPLLVRSYRAHGCCMDIGAVIIGAMLAVALAAAFVAIYENAKKTAHLSHAPFGADTEIGPAEPATSGRFLGESGVRRPGNR